MVKLDFQAPRATLIARVDGELDLHAAQQFRESIDAYLDTTRVKGLLLDFNGVSFIDSSGLGAILGRYKKISQLRGKMAMVNVKPQVKRILEFSGVLRVVSIFETEGKALQNI